MKKVFAEIKEYSVWIFISIIGISLSTMSDLILPRLFASIVDFVNQSGMNGEAVSNFIKATGFQMLMIVVGTLIAATIGNFAVTKITTGFSKKMRSKFFAKVQEFTAAETGKFGTATLITRNTNDISQIQQFIGMLLRIFVRAPITMIGGILMAYGKNAKLAAPMLLSVPIIILIVVVISRIVVPMFSVIQGKLDDLNRVLREQITGVRVVRAFCTEDLEEKRFDDVSSDYRKVNLKMAKATSLMGPLLSIVMNITVVLILLLATRNIQNSVIMQDSDIIAIIQYVTQILFAFVMISMVFVLYPRAKASAKRIYEVLDTNPEIRDLKSTVEPDESLKGQIEFRNVSFGFSDAENMTLEGISFMIKPGQKLGVIGSTGSGKSTLMKLILRFYDVVQGSILVDGVDIREMKQKDLRDRIAYVPQQWQLFSGTISGNIQVGKENATLAEMTNAAKTAQAMDFILEKEGGFEAEVARAGSNFSGGQKQRISIARALVREPEIYLFDDSFSALDAKTDSQLRKAMTVNEGNVTQVIVSSRISTIATANQIMVLDNGKLADIGTHEELMKSSKIYREIADSQFSEEVAV